jgi:Ala-tRNA(Pro) deacylase
MAHCRRDGPALVFADDLAATARRSVICEMMLPTLAVKGGSVMSIPQTLQRYLDQKVTYELVTHDPTMTSARTAQSCRISGDCLAKGVVLRRGGGYMLAVLPASHHIKLPELRTELGADVVFATENEIAPLFSDCARGAVPPVGACYGLDTIVDDAIDEEPDVYLEAGDHMTLIHLDHAQFAKLTAEARRAHFSAHD